MLELAGQGDWVWGQVRDMGGMTGSQLGCTEIGGGAGEREGDWGLAGQRGKLETSGGRKTDLTRSLCAERELGPAGQSWDKDPGRG